MDELLTRFPEPVRKRVFEADELLRAVFPGCIVLADAPGGLIGYGYGPGYKDTLCTIIPSQKGVRLGFYKGSELPDPHGLLAGAGKVHRSLVLPMEGALADPRLNGLLAAALQAYHERMKP